MANSLKYNCIFGGGGIRGVCYIGAVKALEECGIEIDTIAGSSVGAVFAVLYAIGYSAEEIKEFFFDFNFNMFRDININIFDSDLSLSKGEIFLNWLREKIGKKVSGVNYDKNQRIKFKDIKRNLQILTTDINTNTPFIFSKENTPDEEIASAVRASAGLPGLMKPMTKEGSVFVDGDLIKSRAGWEIYTELNNSKTRLLEFRLEGSGNGGNIKNPIDYINSIISTIWYISTENLYNLYNTNDRYDYIVIDTKDLILFDFSIDKNIKELLIEKGYNITKEYFTRTIIDKKQKILNIYINISAKLNILIKNIRKKNPQELLSDINEILSTMYEDTKYIDISVYEKLKELKESIILNTKKPFLLKQKIINEEKINECGIYTAELIEERINELKHYIKNYCNKCYN